MTTATMEPKAKKTKRERAEEILKNGKAGVLPLSEQLTPEEEDARDRAARKAAKKNKRQEAETAPPEPAQRKGEKGTPPPVEPVKRAKGDEAPAEPKASPAREPSEHRPGIISTILRELYKASEENPLTKRAMLDILVKEFPNRSAESMNVTVHSQMLAARLWADKRIKLMSKPVGAGKGFWLPKEETIEAGKARKESEKKAK